MRILMLIPHLGVGGAQGSFLRLAEFLGRHEQVTIAVMQGGAGANTSLPVAELDAMCQGAGKARRWLIMLRRLRMLKRDADVTISFLSGVNLLNALTGPRDRIIVSERGSKQHDIGMSLRRRLIWTRILDPLTYWRSGRVVAASKGLAHEIVTANTWAASRVLAIEGAVDAAALVEAAELPVEEALQSLADHETVVAFGRLHVSKGFDVLLAAFSQIRDQRPLARLLLIGAGPQEARLREIAAGLGLDVAEAGTEADVILPGMRPDPLRYLQLGRVFVLPSRNEGLPNALIEALAAGAAILASDCRWGPRSILSAGALAEGDELTELPLKLQNGVLMPLPDLPSAVDVWVREMDRALSVLPLPRPERGARLAAIERYDIIRTGQRWLELARAMAHEAG